MLLLKVSRMCWGNEYGSAFEFYLNKYNKIPEVISEPNLIDYMKQDYRLAFTILSQSLADKTEITSEQYYNMLVQVISGGFCTNIQVPENLQMSPEQN